MHICGIVAEYNPFHNGHAYQIAATRQTLGPDTAIIAIMSGNYVQRGEAALLPKHLRAEMAVTAGVDLVLELPAVYALQSAEGFALRGVQLLDALGVATHLSFGAEWDNLAGLQEAAALLQEHQTIADTLAELKTGISYAAARERALYGRIREQAQMIRHPNNILAIEYLKALSHLESGISPLVIRRTGPGHDSGTAAENLASASLIRQLVREGAETQVPCLLPEECRPLFARWLAQGQALTSGTLLEAEMAAAFARMTVDSLSLLPDVAEGLEHRLYHAIRSNRGFHAIAAAAQTKRYPLSRIRRLLYCAFLGVTRQHTQEPPAYLRVLAMGDRGRQVLARARKTCSLPLISKPAHVKKLDSTAQRQFEQEALATDLYHIALGDSQALGADWRRDIAYPGGKGDSVRFPITGPQNPF